MSDDSHIFTSILTCVLSQFFLVTQKLFLCSISTPTVQNLANCSFFFSGVPISGLLIPLDIIDPMPYTSTSGLLIYSPFLTLHDFIKLDLYFIFAFYLFFCNSNHDCEGKLQKNIVQRILCTAWKKLTVHRSIYKLPTGKVVTHSISKFILVV